MPHHAILKAILRASGYLALHDEATAYARESDEAAHAAREGGGMDWYSFTVAFKACSWKASRSRSS